jgi:large subunit ribosomal protein L2
MAVKSFKPTTPGRRNMTVASFAEITKKKPEKSLLVDFGRSSGRNNQGKITVRRMGGGHKRKYRIIDFKGLDKLEIPAKVEAIEYDPNRTCYIALVCYMDGERRYVLAPKGLEVGQQIVTAPKAKIRVGNRVMIGGIPESYQICNIELQAGRGGQIVRSAGSAATVVSQEGEFTQVQLPSGEVRYVPKNCYVTIGALSNEDHSNIVIGKAGRNRWKGIRPHVRGKVMNPIDHPHGGGEGNQSTGMKYPKTPWGRPALGVKTRSRSKKSHMIVKARTKKRK